MSSKVPPSLQGADAWAYSLRQHLKQDSCHAQLYQAIQTSCNTIDQYIADIYSAPPSSTTNLIELMKTPGRNRGPETAKKMLPAGLAAAETTLQPVSELHFGTDLEKENARPTETFEPQHDSPFGRSPLLGARNAPEAPPTDPIPAINVLTKPQGPRENTKRPLPPLPKSALVVSTKCVAMEDNPISQSQPAIVPIPIPAPLRVPTPTAAPTTPTPVPIQEITVPLNDTKPSSALPQAGTSETSSIFPTVVRKQSYATLPEPSPLPLRKSTRHGPGIARPQPATTTPVAGSTGASGVRSSWLRRDTHLPDKGLTGVTAKNTMANAGPLNFGLSTDGPLTGSKRKSVDLQDGTEVDEPRSAKIARKESQEEKRDVDIVEAHARVTALAALQEPLQGRPSTKVIQPEPVAQPQSSTEQPRLSIFDDETQHIPHDEDEDTNERLQRLTKIVKAALPGSRGPSGGVVQMEANEKPRSQRPSKEERKDSGRLSVSHLVGGFEKKDRGRSYTSTTPPHSPPLVTAAPPAFKFVPSQPVTATTVAPIRKTIFQPLPPKNAPTRTSSQPVFTVPQVQHPIVPFAPSQPAPNKAVFNKNFSQLPPTSIFDAPPLQGDVRPIGPAWQPISQPFSQGTQSTEPESIFDTVSRGASQPTTVQVSQSSSCEDLPEEEVVTFPGWGAIKPDEEREGETMAWVKNIPGSETEEYIHELDEGAGASDEENARGSSQESEVAGSEVRPFKAVNTTTTATTGGGIFASMASMATKATNQLKSLRLAAAAAEKDKAEKEKKEKRKLEMEARRQAAVQKKADEERGRREDAERKRKAEEERRKKEREEAMANRSTKLGKSTAQQEEASKKPLKPAADTEKKIPQLKKQPSKVGLGTSTTGTNSVKLVASTSFRPQPAASSAATSKLVSQSSTTQTIKKAVASTPKPQHEKQPSQLVQARMQARYQAQLREEDLTEGGIDENADLPDIMSEYSDSEDEDRPKSFNPPEWAQSPNLLTTLENMRTVNPDTIFGAVPKLEMEEIFPGRRGGKFRVRTSSANWAGTDGVTVEEEIEYAKRMGFTK